VARLQTTEFRTTTDKKRFPLGLSDWPKRVQLAPTEVNNFSFFLIIYMFSGNDFAVCYATHVTGTLVKLHGAFMVAAWMFAASCGILFARYFRLTWVGKQFMGKDLWFVVSLSFNILQLSL
jgi:hypothetical protein